MAQRISIQILLIVFALFFFNGLMYLLFRPTSLLIFKLANETGLYELLLKIRAPISPTFFLPKLIIYNLPAFAWTFSFTALLGIIWNYEISKHNILVLIMPIGLGVTSEIFQLMNLIKGTYDIIDIIFYIVGGSFGFFFIKYFNHKLK